MSHDSFDANKKSTTPNDLKESLKVLVMLREVPGNFVENKDPSRPSFENKEGPISSFSKDYPSLSYDGKNIRPSSSLNLIEAPRLYLDNR